MDVDSLSAIIAPTIEELYGKPKFRIAPLVGHASARRYHRVHIGVRSCILMELGSRPRNCEEICDRPPPGDELPFVSVQRFLSSGNIAVPKILKDLQHEGVLLLEDLGDITMEGLLLEAGIQQREALYFAAVDELIKLQKFAQSTDGAHPSFQWQLTEFVLLRELEHFDEWLLKASRGVRLTPVEQEEVKRSFMAIANELASLPPVWCHRDFQSRNLICPTNSEGNRQMAILDFQDALVGPPLYDLVSLLRDSYVGISDELLNKLLTHYYKEMDLPWSEESYRRLFWLQTLQRKMKDAGRFVYIERVKQNDAFLQYVPLSMRYIREALDTLPDFPDLRRILCKYLPELTI